MLRVMLPSALEPFVDIFFTHAQFETLFSLHAPHGLQTEQLDFAGEATVHYHPCNLDFKPVGPGLEREPLPCLLERNQLTCTVWQYDYGPGQPDSERR